MKSRNLSPCAHPWLGLAAIALLLSPALSRPAHAFGGLWTGPDARVTQSGASIIFVDHPDARVTAIIQMQYRGPSDKFAWLIPVPATPSVGISSSTVFERLAAATAPRYWVGTEVEGSCMQPLDLGPPYDAQDEADVLPEIMAGPVLAAAKGSVGPYDYVHLPPAPGVGDAEGVASDWLASHGFELTDLDSKVLRPYLRDGYHLLVFKLSEGVEAGAIRPVTLTYESTLPTIPLRLTALAAQEHMEILVWVFGASQAVPENYQSLVLNDALIDWSTGRKFAAGALPAGGAGPFGPVLELPRNYSALVTAAADEAGGRGFVSELGGPASQYRDKIWTVLDQENFDTLSSELYADGIDAIYAAHRHYGRWDGFRDAIEGATTLPAGTTFAQFAADPNQYRGAATVDAARFLRLLDEKVVAPVADTAALFHQAPYLTRLYSTMSAAEMSLDPVFNYNIDLNQISNVHVAQQRIECDPAQPRPEDAPWRMALPQGGLIVGNGGGWPLAMGSLPANLKVVSLSTRGSGSVVQDNTTQISMALVEHAGAHDGSLSIPRPPQHGTLIGGTQSVRPFVEPSPTTDGAAGAEPGGTGDEASNAGDETGADDQAGDAGSTTRSGGGCSAVRRVDSPAALELGWLSLAGLALALRRRQRSC